MKIIINDREMQVPGKYVTFEELIFVSGVNPKGRKKITFTEVREGKVEPGQAIPLEGVKKISFIIEDA